MFKIGVLLVALSSVAFAVDGVILIDQNRALAGNVTPGDAPGFPVTITQPGSYRLSGKLTAPAGVGGVVIAASSVTLDLNGFSIEGPGLFCISTQCSHIQAITLSGAQQGIVVRNGIILGFTGFIDLSSGSLQLIEGLILGVGSMFGGNNGLSIGTTSVMKNTTAAIPIFLSCPVAVSGSASNNGFIRAGSNPNSCSLTNVVGPIF